MKFTEYSSVIGGESWMNCEEENFSEDLSKSETISSKFEDSEVGRRVMPMKNLHPKNPQN